MNFSSISAGIQLLLVLLLLLFEVVYFIQHVARCTKCMLCSCFFLAFFYWLNALFVAVVDKHRYFAIVVVVGFVSYIFASTLRSSLNIFVWIFFFILFNFCLFPPKKKCTTWLVDVPCFGGYLSSFFSFSFSKSQKNSPFYVTRKVVPIRLSCAFSGFIFL